LLMQQSDDRLNEVFVTGYGIPFRRKGLEPPPKRQSPSFLPPPRTLVLCLTPFRINIEARFHYVDTSLAYPPGLTENHFWWVSGLRKTQGGKISSQVGNGLLLVSRLPPLERFLLSPFRWVNKEKELFSRFPDPGAWVFF